MTSYDGAFEMAIGANIAVAIGNEASCAGKALADYGLAHVDEIPAEMRKVWTHVIDHLQKIASIATVMDEYYDGKIETFAEENPGKMDTIAEEIGHSEFLSQLQDAVGMSEDAKDQIRAAKLAQIKEDQEAK